MGEGRRIASAAAKSRIEGLEHEAFFAMKGCQGPHIGIEEDNYTGELQQHGLSSLLAEPGPLSWKEVKVQAIALWVLDRVLA